MKLPIYLFFALFSTFLVASNCLECYTGFAIIRGRKVGTETKTCSKSSDSCYKANADLNTITKLKLAGCSTWRCMLSQNRCTMQVVSGQSVELCCCKGDRCNAPESNVDSAIKGLITHISGKDKDKNPNNGNSRGFFSNIFG